MEIENDNKVSESKKSISINMTSKSKYIVILEKKLESRKMKIVKMK